jgi:hypothetical protein
MRRAIRNALVAVSVLSVPISATAAQLSPIPLFGNWSGGAYDDDQTGKFMRCIASSPHPGGIDLAVAMERNRDWSLGFENQEWNLLPDVQVQLSIKFDDQRPWSGSAFALDAHTVLFPMPTDFRSIASFRAAYRMTVTATGEVYSFKLDGTSRLMVSLGQCVGTQLAKEPGKPTNSAGMPGMLSK